MFIKLCGLRTVQDVEAALVPQPTALGFILAESRRKVEPEFVASLRAHFPMLPTVVGVTVNQTAADNDHLYEVARLDMLQLSGDEPLSILDELDVPVIKVLRFAASTRVDDAIAEVDAWMSHSYAPELVIVDSHVSGEYGGSGVRADVKLVSELAVRYPIVLAGGLTPENIAEAIRLVKPMGVDTSSGTETDGVKDPAKLAGFVDRARSAFIRYSPIA